MEPLLRRPLKGPVPAVGWVVNRSGIGKSELFVWMVLSARTLEVDGRVAAFGNEVMMKRRARKVQGRRS